MSTLTFDNLEGLLPPGFKSSTTEKPDFSHEISSIFKDVQTDDISALLPPGFKLETSTERTETSNPSQEPPSPEPSTTTEPTEMFGLKFPTRPGGVQKLGLPDIEKHSPPATPAPLEPKIKSFSDM